MLSKVGRFDKALITTLAARVFDEKVRSYRQFVQRQRRGPDSSKRKSSKKRRGKISYPPKKECVCREEKKR